jgi:2-keto-3-deoxy-L-rhamnonate aldolase RhmA
MSFKSKLADPSLLLNVQLCVIPSAVTTQAIAAAGADCIIIDMEHGPIDFATLHAMVASTQGTTCAPLVRVPEIHEVHVKKALDTGAEGICFPLARSVDDVRRAVASMRYPPQGKRGWGPFVAHSRWGVPLLDYTKGPALETICMVLIETVDALESIDAICAVDGVDCFVIAPFDLSTELGVSGQMDHPRMKDAVSRIEAAVHKVGVPLGGFAFTQDAAHAMISRGYRLLGGVDLLSLKSAVALSRSWLAR